MIMVGSIFGRLTVLAELPPRNERAYCLCACACGVELSVRQSYLRAGHTRSCGCLAKDIARVTASAMGRKYGVLSTGVKHGLINTPEYRVWAHMKGRCLNPHAKGFQRYGGRGIKVCEQWIGSFPQFLADVGTRPSPEHSIERIRNEEGYSPNNCIWANATVQARNRRNNRRITINGVTKVLAEWLEKYGLADSTFRHRVGKGMSPEAALTALARQAGEAA